MLQDSGRVVIFGAKTAGAGGHVKGYTYPSRFGVNAFSLTGSLVYRLDGRPIENMGVMPDVPYEMTMRDIRDNYADYINAVNKTVGSLLK